MYHFTGIVSPLRGATSLEELVSYPLPDYGDPSCWEHLTAEVVGLHERGLAAHGLMGQTIFETAWLIRSMEELLPDMLGNPDWAAVLLDRIAEIRRIQSAKFAEADVDIIRTGDDVASQRGMLMDPETWREWLKPRLASIIDSAREVKPDVLIWYHSDGDCRAIIPDLIEIGVDILNPVQPECMDPAEVKKLYGDRLSFSGTIGTQTTMPFGTPEEVRSEIKKRIHTVGRGGGLLIAPTHVLEPDVPWENVLAFVDGVRSFGRYKNGAL
jgi:uroporphyrinogen decarboxylase